MEWEIAIGGINAIFAKELGKLITLAILYLYMVEIVRCLYIIR